MKFGEYVNWDEKEWPRGHVQIFVFISEYNFDEKKTLEQRKANAMNSGEEIRWAESWGEKPLIVWKNYQALRIHMPQNQVTISAKAISQFEMLKKRCD